MIKLWFLTLTVLTISLSKAWQQYDKCDLGYEEVGCFVDKAGKGRALPEELLNERDRTNPAFDGHYISWKKYGESVHGLACRCAAKTKEKGYKVFGLQFYGECWSGPGGENTFSKYGEADRTMCVQDIYSPTDTHCNKSKKQECIGKQLTNYVYHIKEAPPSNPVDGGYTTWSDWTPCTKTCGGGITTRFRTCTNPKPQNGGKDCLRLGAAEESKACSEDVCPVPCKKALDIGIIMDGSTSVRKRNFQKAKKFFEKLISYFTVSAQGTHFGVIVYSTNAKIEFTMADNRYYDPKALQERIEAIRYPRGWTRTDKALELASNKLFTPAGGDRPDKPNVLIVFTDGKTNKGSKPYSEVLPPLAAKGVQTIAIGIGHHIKDSELLTIAMGKPENVIKINNFDVLQEKLGVLLQDSCKAPPSNPVDGGYTTWSDWTPCTKTCGGGVTTRFRTCTNPKPQNGGKGCSRLGAAEESKACSEDVCPIPCKKALDIGIIMDGSTSVRKRNFRKAKKFFEKLVNYFKVSAQGTHFGVIVYSTNAKIEFTMVDSRYYDPIDLVKQIETIRYPQGWTRTDKALELASNELFTPAGGDRPGKPNVLIVFTDGKTNKASKPYWKVLRPLAAKGVQTIAIGIGRYISEKELLIIAMDKPENVIKINNFDVLQEKLGVLLQNACKGSY